MASGGEHYLVKVDAGWLSGEFAFDYMCDLIRIEDAAVLGSYGADFYAGTLRQVKRLC